jgi:hypothetical protein
LSKWLLFEFEVSLERDLEGRIGGEGIGAPEGNSGKVVESWEEEESEDALTGEEARRERDWAKKEAERRAAEYVKLKKGL